MVPSLDESNRAVVVGAVLVFVAGVAVFPYMVKVIVRLKNRVVLQDPIVLFRDKGLQKLGDEPAVVHRRNKVTEVVQQRADNGFLILAVP